jgi:hypothetical protein
MTFGGVAGDLFGTVTLTDSAFLNSFIQEFAAGSLLTMRLTLTTEVDPGPTPDQFSFAILDNTGFEIPTQGLGGVGTDVFLLIDINSANPATQIFGTDTSRFPFGGGDPIDMAAPDVSTPIPEPATWVLVLIALASVGIFRKVRPPRGGSLL